MPESLAGCHRMEVVEREGLPRSYWLALTASLLVLVILLSVSVVGGMRTVRDNSEKVFQEATKNSVSNARSVEFPPRPESGPFPGDGVGGGLWAVFAKDAAFAQPIRADWLEAQFSFRTGFEWNRIAESPAHARLTGLIFFPKAGDYMFYVDCNDAGSIEILGQKIFDEAPSSAIHKPVGPFSFPAGWLPISAEWHNYAGNGWFGLQWSGPGVSGFIPRSHLAPMPGMASP